MSIDPRNEGGAVRKFGYELDKIGPATNEAFPEESPYWYSVPRARTVLAVVRSVTTTLALIDLLSDLFGDRRVQIVFTVMPKQRDANFEGGMRRMLAEFGVREVRWEEAVRTRFDLVVTASHEGLLHELSGPLLILNHGVGIGKYLAVPPDGRLPLGRDPDSTTTIVLSHQEQRAYFAAEQDERVSFLVGGDPWYDRLRASLSRVERYRDAIGVRPGCRLIAVSSTWGEYSLIATNPELFVKLLAQLPSDEYRVAAILHPNVWFGHSTWQIRTWLREAIDAGLILAPPRDAWRGVLVAADGFVGDHGSVMLLAAGLEKPVCFGSAPNDELIAGGPSAEIEASVLRLDGTMPLKPQIEQLFSSYEGQAHRVATERVFEHPGCSHAILRRAAYDLLRLDEPSTPPRVLAVDLPEVLQERVTAHHVRATINPDGSVSVARFPAKNKPHPSPRRTPPPQR